MNGLTAFTGETIAGGCCICPLTYRAFRQLAFTTGLPIVSKIALASL
jgi:hypothetical protein